MRSSAPNEIKTAAPMLDAIEIAGRVITADALLTQRDLANYLVERGAHYHFTVKGNQPKLQEDIRLLFAQRGGGSPYRGLTPRPWPHRNAPHLVFEDGSTTT